MTDQRLIQKMAQSRHGEDIVKTEQELDDRAQKELSVLQHIDLVESLSMFDFCSGKAGFSRSKAKKPWQ